MGRRLYFIFITNQEGVSDEEILNKLGLKHFKKGNRIKHFITETSKQFERLYIGSFGTCKVICNGELVERAFEDDNPFLQFKNSEIAAIWISESSGSGGFCLIWNGQFIRKLSISDDDFIYNYGSPIPEENVLSYDKLSKELNIEHIYFEKDAERLRQHINSERVYRVAILFSQRYLGFPVDYLYAPEIILHEYVPN